jgi:D-glycero-D-manno-heptose 1,7-bisphosphate phosphatase
MSDTPWIVFLDRDGTLVPDARHAARPEQLRLYRSAPAGLRALAGEGALLLVVSNQSAVARGLLDRPGLRRMDRRLKSLVRRAGARIERAYYCPHHPELTGPCRCRKPSAGMLREGLRDYGVRARDGFMVGDTVADLEAGRSAGVATVLVLTGHGRRARGEAMRRGLADAVVRDLAEAARWILAARARRAR